MVLTRKKWIGGFIIGFLTASILAIELVPERYTVINEIVRVEIAKTMMAEVTAYTSDIRETDDTPEIMASGRKVYDGAVACPAKLKFGTKVEIAGREYVCEDRMAKKYRETRHFDVWMADRGDAIVWGRRTLEITVKR